LPHVPKIRLRNSVATAGSAHRTPAAELADAAREREQLQAYVVTKIRAGEPLKGNYPPGEDTFAECTASSAGTDGPSPPGP
jgi:hypothetical protein